MADIVERLRAITGQAGDYGDVQLCDAAADEIERLRGYRNEAESEASIASLVVQKLKEKPCPYVTGTVTQYCTLTPFTLTDAERVAIDWAAMMASRERDTAADAASRGYKPEGGGDPAQWAKAHGERAATLRGLLERTSPERDATPPAADAMPERDAR